MISPELAPEYDGPAHLSQMTIRELIGELARLQDRRRHDAAACGYQPMPGQTARTAAILRREQQISAELRRRRGTGAVAGNLDA